MFKKFTQWFDNPPQKNAPDNRLCDHPGGCSEAGLYRAPKSRDHLEKGVNDWYWLCLHHIRDYNNSWNYYKNMSEEQINTERTNDVTWDRPSWAFGDQNPIPKFNFKDPFGFFEDGKSNNASPPPPVKEQEALALLELSIPFTKEQLQKNYRRLAKKYHPDANKDDAEAEEMIRRINQAYSSLQKISGF